MSQPSPTLITKPDKIKPDLGLYQTQYLLRQVLPKLPGVRKLSPNLLSIAALAPGLLAAVFLFEGQWLAAILSIAARMIFNTPDRLVAEAFNKKTPIGGHLNHLTGELTDIHRDRQDRTQAFQQPQASL